VENRPGAPHLLAGQTSIDDDLKEKYDLTPQLPSHWAAFETASPGRRRDAADSAPTPPARPSAVLPASAVGAARLGQGNAFALAFTDQSPLKLGEGIHDRKHQVRRRGVLTG
jgi:hypothetical protein